ncbi:MAG: NifB/NifX family molybdenum-iron cluster-binding protein [Gemmatimonadota bacterium]|nr:NifB/NifX family molybdenum-iron cluster-binding protein [Gemmatimonadota bacterium]
MKIAVTSQGEDLSSPVDPRFGRAINFLIVDTETGTFETLDNNQNLNLPQGAGIQSAEAVAASGVEAVLTGNCGPNAFRTLSAADIKVYNNAGGTVAEAVEKFKAGELIQAETHDVNGHQV